MKQQAPNPIEMCEAATKRAHSVLAAVKPGQLTRSTPCSDWNVQQLMDHFVDAAAHVTSVLSEKPQQAPQGKNTVERFDHSVASLLKEARRPGMLKKKVKGPMGEMTGSAMVVMFLSDMVVHSWDLAKATGQNTRIDSKLAEAAHAFYQGLPPTGIPGFFDPRHEVPASASPQKKVLALTGRKA